MKINKLTKVSSKNSNYIHNKLNRHLLIYFNIKILYYILLYYIINITKEETSNPISIIRMKIKGTEDTRILNNKFNYTPDEIIVNRVSQKQKGKFEYNLTESVNNVTLIWKTRIINCSNMFSNVFALILILL